MKNTKSILIIGLVLVVLIITKAFATPTSVNITNNSDESIGIVTLNLVNQSQVNYSVGGNGSYNLNVEPTVASVTINGQTIPIGNSGTITLPNSHSVVINTSTDGSGNQTGITIFRMDP